ncbi:MAG TPA: YggT family protein [Patescibacteria group bacterium]
MAETQQVIREKQSGVTPSGKQVVSEKTQVSSSSAEKYETVGVITNLVLYGAGVIEILLLFRFILKILGANPGSMFVSFIYTVSGIFEMPFRGIFHSTATQGIETSSILEPSTVVALFVYLVIAVGITQLIRLLTATNKGD